jgi:hypothetical protein
MLVEHVRWYFLKYMVWEGKTENAKKVKKSVLKTKIKKQHILFQTVGSSRLVLADTNKTDINKTDKLYTIMDNFGYELYWTERCYNSVCMFPEKIDLWVSELRGKRACLNVGSLTQQAGGQNRLKK